MLPAGAHKNAAPSAAINQERIHVLNKRIDKLERECYEVLIKNQKEIQKAREELEHIRENADAITFPDGEERRVYRDGEKVRTENSCFVGSDIIKSDDIPHTAPDWSARIDFLQAVRGDICAMCRVRNTACG